ncbi:MAG TPA: hypothetical protein DCP92_17005 [Nitrospiraceae bacterium]|nr:hypothetical protein [Nitrospiraceae bacterium]
MQEYQALIMKADLDRQIARLSEFAASRRLAVIEVVKEIGSGLNGHRRAVLKILRNPKVHTVVLYPSLRRKTWFLQRRRNRMNYKCIMRMEAVSDPGAKAPAGHTALGLTIL